MSSAPSILAWAIVVALGALSNAPRASAADLSIEGPFATSDAVYCMGTLHVTSDTVADAHYGDIKIQGRGSPGACDVVCGDGIVEGLEECDPMGGAPGCSSNCKWLRFPEYGGSSPYLDAWSDVLECRGRPVPVPNSPSGRDVTFQFGDMKIPFVAEDFLLSFSLPNFYFHSSMAYGILRSKGVPLGKRDFLGRLRIKR